MGDRETAYYLGKEDGERRALLGLSPEDDLSIYNADYIFGYSKGFEILDDNDRGFKMGYDDARAGRDINSTIAKLSKPFRHAYLRGFDAYLETTVGCAHSESEAAA